VEGLQSHLLSKCSRRDTPSFGAVARQIERRYLGRTADEIRSVEQKLPNDLSAHHIHVGCATKSMT
jgi:hypothetical protein